MACEHLRIHEHDGVLQLILDRPNARNALNLAMYRALREALVRAQHSETITCVVLTGSHGMFTAGNDIRDFLDNPPESFDHPAARFITALSHFPKPVLAAVDGYAVGIGSSMLLHVDLVYATSRAQFQLPFVDLGVVPEAGSTLLLPRLCGHPRAAELLYFGERFTAQTAVEVGLVNAIVAPDELESHVLERARTLAQKPRQALLTTKQLLREPIRRQLDTVVKNEFDHVRELLKSDTCRRILANFFARRGSSDAS